KEHEREFLVLNPAAKNFEKGLELKDTMAAEYGPYLLVTKSADGDVYHRSSSGGYLMNVVLELHDALTPKLFWTKSFKEAPTVSFSHNEKRLVMGWSADTETGQEEIKADAAIHRRWNDLDDKQSAMVYDVMDADSGEVQSRLFVDTGNHSFSVQYSLLSGGFLVLADDQGQCIVYSLATGEIIGRVFWAGACLGSRGRGGRHREWAGRNRHLPASFHAQTGPVSVRRLCHFRPLSGGRETTRGDHRKPAGRSRLSPVQRP